jgi:hypothetical protein
LEEFHVAATLLAITAQALTRGVLEAAVSEEYREPVQNGPTDAIGSDLVVTNGPFRGFCISLPAMRMYLEPGYTARRHVV